MATYVGSNYRRKEDYRLLTGKSEFVADMKLHGMLEVAFVRSMHAHAEIAVDGTEALKMPGVHAVLTARDLAGVVGPLNPLEEFRLPQDLIDTIHPVLLPCPEDILAVDKVVYAGQPIAMVIAENRYLAEDAAARVLVKYTPLPVLADPFRAREPGAPPIHPAMGSNVQASLHVEVGDVERGMAEADCLLKRRFVVPRVTANPLETRGVLADYDRRSDSLTVWTSTQVTFMVRSNIAKLLDIPEEKVRVVAPDVGGGFGTKGGVYPEEIAIAYAARRLGRPVKWIEDRMEHMQSCRQSRDQVHEVEVAFNRDGRILALKDEFVVDSGAYNPLLVTCPYNTVAHMRGMFKIPNFAIAGACVITNKTPSIAYRGAGRPEAVFVMDRLIQIISRELGLDPVEVMEVNLIRPEEMPYDQGMYYRDGTKLVYDSGDYPATLHHALELAEYDRYRALQRERRSEGEYIGIGISSYIEGTGIGPFEGAVIRVDATGQIVAYIGSTPHGQSHETTLSQICADEFGVSPEQVTVRAGDTSLLPYGVGTFASRGAVTAGSAVQVASQKLREKMMRIASHTLEIPVEDLEMRDGKVFARQMPGRSMSFRDIARAARPGPNPARPADLEPGVEATHYFVPPSVTYSGGVHVAVVRLDKDTGQIDIIRYVVVHDCGRVLNPMVVDGQIQGGVAQGLGEAMYEQIVHDEQGQLLTGTYMDYLQPTAMEVPDVIQGHSTFLSTRNAMGVKGVGEGGAISPPAAIANAVSDALSMIGIEVNEVPVTPVKVLQYCREADARMRLAAAEGAR
ncbi:MAG: xanthine dehydrogenase family protein molybdopterin-binding subunit [Alicyclobacillus sp.]|nr:xanthine dehydrogenase family protein molybdopterin-binding subunit [Alicyclobacillus sp.]